jgi:hypothetical protein
MKAIKFDKIEKQYQGWLDYYSENKKRGEDAIDFVLAGNQWKDDVVAKREDRGQESLTFNLVIKHLRRAHTQMGEIEFNLDLSPTNSKYDDNVDEMAALRLLLSSITLNDETLEKFNEAGRKCLNYGFSFAEINFGYENYDTLCLEPKLIIHRDPSIAFWDKNALHPTKVDGRFAGFCRTLTDKELIEKYPNLKRAGWLQAKDNKVYDYWWREYSDMDYITLETGVQKREDLLTYEDKQIIKRNAPKETRKVCDIYFQRSCCDKVLEEPRKFPLADLLPLVYHPGLTEWHATKGDITIPYCEYMTGAQKLHNYLLSQLASQAKNANGDKWIFPKESVTTQTERDNAKNINKRDGSFTFNGDISKIRREQPAQLSSTLLDMAQITKQEIDEINGAMIDTQNAQQTVIAAKALDKITHNMEAINMYFMAGHITFVNQIGKIYRQMIPQLYTQERTLLVKKKDGAGHAITINQDAGTGKLINNIKDINNNFYYEITAGPSSTMMKENTIKYLMEVYNINPAMFQATAHIFFRNLQTQDAGELSRIALALGDENLIKYEMTLDEYKGAKDQEMQQQLKQRQQLASLDPQVQSAQALASAEHRKAAAAEYDAQTKRIKEINTAQQKQQELKLKAMELVMNGDLERDKHQLEALNTEIKRNQQYLDALQEAQRMNLEREKHQSQMEMKHDTSTAKAESAVY